MPIVNNGGETKRITPAEMGINAMAGNAGDGANDGNWIDIRGYNQIALFVRFVASGDATSAAMTFNIEVSDDGGTNGYYLQTESKAWGVVTLSQRQYSSATNNADHNFAVDFPCNSPYFRIRDVAVATGHANDTIYVSAILGRGGWLGAVP